METQNTKLFGDVLLETTPAERRRRRFTLVITLAGEALVIAALIAVPLLYLDAVPGMSVHASTVDLPRVPAPIGIADAHHGPANGTPSGPHLPTVPTHALPNPLLIYGDARPRWQSTDVGSVGDSGIGAPGCPGCVPGGTGTNLVGAANLPAAPRRAIISHLDEGMITHRVDPVYPILARQAHVQGEVVLRATISKDGHIESVQLVSGHPMLAAAAVNAVSQWRFRPYVLNGSPVEVEAQVIVNFRLGNQ
jgi:protein TonB